jgi:putative transposase
MNELYRIIGISKQAVHKYLQKEEGFQKRLATLVMDADLLREEHPGCGVEKMYHTLNPGWLGRDRFIEVMMGLGYRVKRIRSYTRTTIPACYKYPNLIEGMVLWDKNQLWQTDITYFKVGSKYCYLIFIEDVYSRRILGYQASDHMKASANIAALRMALRTRGDLEYGLIHHSDRGSQYVEKTYTGILIQNDIHISMGLKAQDNAYAERVNGIIKNEYLAYWKIDSLKELKKYLKQAVTHYNNKRMHSSLLPKTTPLLFEKEIVNLDRQKRPTVIVYAEGKPEIKWASSPLDFLPEKTLRVPVCPMLTNSQ